MIFATQPEGDVMRVFLSGEIDMQRSPDARRALLAQVERGHGLIVDLGDVQYMDSSGIASLVEAYQAARDARLHFALARVTEPVMQVLTLTRLDTVFPILR
jgi:anti-sigma B factor antagonist